MSTFVRLLGSDSSPLGGAFLTATTFTYWTWCPCCWEKLNGDISALELACVVLGVGNGIGDYARGKNLYWLTDSKSSCQTFHKGYNSNPLSNSLVLDIKSSQVIYQIQPLKLIHVPRRCLPHNDSLTRGDCRSFIADPANKNRTHTEVTPNHSFFIVSKGSGKFKPPTLGFRAFHKSS